MKKEMFLKYLDTKSDAIDRELTNRLGKGKLVPNLHDGIIYSLGLDIKSRSRRGKRLRPTLCLATCEALNGNMNQAMIFAIVCELMHNYFLIHDDIEDGDKFRRNRPAVWVKYGLAHGINIGDFMATRMFEILAELHALRISAKKFKALYELMVTTLNHTHTGQTRDMNARGMESISEEEYLEIVTEKTGYYLSMPLVGGAIIAGATPAMLDNITSYGRYIGPVYQIMDDVIDLTEGKGRGEKGSDIKEGKRSFLVASTTAQCTPAERQRMYKILDKSRLKTTKADIDWMMKLFKKYEIIENATQKAESLAEKGIKSLGKLPPRLVEFLTFFAEFLTRRTA